MVLLLTLLPATYVTAVPPRVPSAAGGPSPTVPGPSAASVVGPSATPILSESVSSGTVGTTVSFSISGFAHGSSFSISWVPSGGKVTFCVEKTTSTGTLSSPCQYTIPPTGAGNYTLTGTDGAGHSASVVFEVLPSLSVSPTSGSIGTIVIVTGLGFSSTTSSTSPVSVTVTWNTVVTCPPSTTTTSLYGSFQCAFPLPAASAGSHALLANDSNGIEASTPFTVVPRLTVSPAYVVGGPGFAPSGATVEFTGSGFGSGASVAVTWTIGTACSAAASPNGGFNCSYTIPSEAPGGFYTVLASDGTNHASVGLTVTFVLATPLTTAVPTTVNISGGGFTAGSTVTISWAGGTLAPVTANATGTFPTFPFSVPTLPSGSYPFSAHDTAGLSAAFALTVLPSLSVNRSGGPPTTSVLWSGTGFAASSSVTVTWPYGSVCAPSTTTDANGAFSCPFTIPGATPGGAYLFTATDAAGHTASGTFTVTFLSVLPPSGPIGTSLTLSGGGFAPGVAFNVTLGSTKVCSNTTTSTGALGCPKYKLLTGAPAGPISFVVLDARGETASAQFTVVPQLSAGKSATVVVGTKVVFNGTGFAALASVSVGWQGGAACSNTSTSLGNVTCSFVLPATPAGPYTFTATDAASNTARVILTVVPRLLAAPSSGGVGTTVALLASGFSSGSAISISSSAGLACTGTTDFTGSFSCSYSVPPTVKGSLVFAALDASSDSASATFSVSSQLAVSPLLGPVGSLLTFSGTGYAPGSLATVGWAQGTACTGTTSVLGSFSCTYVLVASTAGLHTFTGKDSVNPPDSASALFSVEASVTLDLSTGTVGAALAVSGTGFASNATVTVAGGTTTICTGVSGTFGSFSCTGTVPAAPAGGLLVTASDTSSHVADTTFSVLPGLVLSPTSGPVDTNISFAGSGFAASSAVSVAWSGGTVCTAVTNPSGSFGCSVVMPPATAGPHTFTATDASANTASASFSVVTSFSTGLSATPSGGPPGTDVTLHGTGFAAGVLVNVTWAGGLACSNVTDSSGTFSCTFPIPALTAGGTYTFSGSDGQGNSASAIFTVTYLSVQPSRGPIGTVATFSGGGFADLTAYSVSWGAGTIWTGTTSASGSFTFNFTIPATASGSYKFTASDGVTSASAAFNVSPVLTVSSPSGPVGTALTFAGSAYAPSASFYVNWTGGTACSGLTDSTGSFSCTFTVTPAAGGSHFFTGSDAKGNLSAVLFAVTPTLLTSPGSGPVGTTATFSGNGFASGAGVAVNGTSGAGCAAIADATGDFSCSITVGALPAGTYPFVADQGSGLPTAATSFSVVSNLTVTPLEGPVGTALDFSATGFGGSVPIQVDWASGTACSGTTSPTGAFTCSFAVSAALVGGNSTFTARDTLGNSATTLVLVIPALSVSPPGGGSGSTLTFSGFGFAASSAVTVTWSQGTACTSTSDGTGAFSCSFVVPLATPGGPYTFAATDGLGNRALAVFVVTYLSVTPGTATVGTLLTFTGGGFAPSVSYALSWAGGAVCAATTTSGGTFRCTFLLPGTSAGPHAFTATDGAGGSASTSVLVVPALSTSPVAGPSGTPLTISGTGFAASLGVQVNWSFGLACTTTTSAAGGFSCPYTLPTVPIGVYRFYANDTAGNAANSSFDVALPATFNVTFSEAGLPAGTSWTVTLNGASVTGTTASAAFLEPSGNYSFTVRAAGYRASPASGSLTVSGGAASVSVSFTPAVYAVTFSQTGLSGPSWTVSLGGVNASTTGPSLTFDVPNGTYNYSLAPLPGYVSSVSGGTLSVSGTSPPTVSIMFTRVEYTLTFDETGLPAGASWSVVLNGVTGTSSTATITFERPNGTYSYSVGSPGFTASPPGGTITVNGSNPAARSFAFSTTTYPVTFVANGLPSSASWSVAINGTPTTATGPSLVVHLANGTYNWKATSTGYRVTDGSGSGTLVVSGPRSSSLSVNFTAFTSTITFVEKGLPSGSTWAVVIAGVVTLNQSTSNATAKLANGTYYLSYDAPPGYVAPTGRYLNVTGTSQTVTVQMTSVNSLATLPPQKFLGYEGETGYYILAGIIAGVGVASGVIGYVLARRSKTKSLAQDFL